LGLVVLAGFALRCKSYDWHSAWLDELYSVSVSNPAAPFLTTFGDPGNPPLYYVLLRVWFGVCGWTEKSGRFFSAFIGTAAIVPFYFFVKRFADKKAALLAALYMAVSAQFVVYSQEMRNYILMVFLVLIAANQFFVIITSRKLDFVNMLRYIIPSILLANTHYYGSLFVFANFLFFLVFSITTKIFSRKNVVLFLGGNENVKSE
jgi:uncharacterized membrane protein